MPKENTANRQYARRFDMFNARFCFCLSRSSVVCCQLLFLQKIRRRVLSARSLYWCCLLLNRIHRTSNRHELMCCHFSNVSCRSGLFKGKTWQEHSTNIRLRQNNQKELNGSEMLSNPRNKSRVQDQCRIPLQNPRTGRPSTLATHIICLLIL